jgi:membrane protein implicated in regulation of membrane protease activity
MGIFSEMMSGADGNDEQGGNGEAGNGVGGEVLGYGEFVYNAGDVLAGYRIFRKRYILRQTILRLVLVTIALASSVFMLITDGASPITITCVALCVIVAAWFIKTPINNKKKTSQAVKELEGESYAVEITADTAKIMLADDKADAPAADASTESAAGTLIHLDQYIVDILDTNTLYIIVAAKRYVFVIPKSAFDSDTNIKIGNTLKSRLETRYKTIEE